MKIAIDARMMGPLQTRGIGRYIEELVRALIKSAPQHELILLVRDPKSSPFQDAKNVRHLKADIPWYGFEEQMKMTSLLKRAKADVIHFPHWNMPLGFSGKCVVTVHDLLLVHQPASAKASTRNPITAGIKRLGHRFVLRHALQEARQICVPSKWVAEDVRRLSPKAAHKIMVTSEGLSRFPAPDAERVPSDPFLFYVGSAYPHKRLDLLLEAWETLARRHPHISLIIAGEQDVFMERYRQAVERKNIPRVQFPGRLTDAELAAHLDHATEFVFPSSNEGFGLPPLEALSRGCPVVSSDSTCLPEILPTQGVFFFRDGDENDMIRAVETVLDPRSHARESAAQAASIVRQRYRWEETAKRTLEAYERARI